MAEQEDRAAEEASTPSHQGSGGGDLATTIGARDEERSGSGETSDRTGVQGSDKVQPQIPTRADHEGAAS